MARRILIVDDLAGNRRILSKMLSGDYETVEAASGFEAENILVAQHQQISAVLLDISMPEMDGYEVLRRMREDPKQADIPVIMITGTEDEKARAKALILGANDFVMKPYNSEIIKHCLRNNISLRESASIINDLQRDKLTGLLQRDTFFKRAAELIKEKPPGYYIMAFFDVDKFKVINDQYGTAKGDEILQYIAKVFKDGLSPYGGICCRITADNFAVLYPESLMDTAETAQIRSKATKIAGIVAPLVFSIGRYIVDDPSMQPSAMLDRAVIAAESVKGRYDKKIALYDESMRAHLLHEQEVVMEMGKALKERQFEVWYQPQINHSTNAQIGSEALVRWRHPEQGLLPPGAFIPIFEENGFIFELDKFVWEEVCATLRQWMDEGRNPLPVSVNISRDDLFRPDVMDIVSGLVDKYRLPADMLRLEITETAFAQSAQYVIDVVKAFIARGFTVEIDDFGSGYSSLNTLKDVPAQILKLDMRFLESSNSERGGNIVESVVRMAKWLGMSVIAEGVETAQQADYLRSIGCSYVQGYLYAKPMPRGDYEKYCCGAAKEEMLLTLETVENLDNNSFWDPESMDTLIFNSYVGAACIYEYHNENIELLRATEKYAQVIGSAGMTVESALKLNWTEHLDAENRARVNDDLRTAIASQKEVTGEYVFLDLPGCPHETHLRSTMRVIASAGERYLVYCTNENITAQRQAEKREREVAEEMRLIMGNVDCGICASVREPDGSFQVLYANDRFFSMYGYTKEQMEAELGGVTGAVHPEDLDRTLAIVERLLQDRGSAAYEYRCVKRDGSIIAVRCVSTVTPFAGISDTVLLSVIDDVTERLASERQIRKLSERLQAIMDNVDLGIIAAVVDGGDAEFIFANDRYYSMLGYTKAQFANEIHSPYETVAPEDLQKISEQTARLNETGQTVTLEYYAVMRNGQRRFFRAAVSVGRLTGIASPVQLSVVRDITEEKELALRERRAAEQAQAIMQDMVSGLTATIMRDGKAEVIFSNERFYEMRGYTREQYRTEVKDYFSLIHPEDRERVWASSMAVYSSATPMQQEYRMLSRDHTERWMRVSMSVTRFTGIDQPVVLSVYSDITNEKRADAEIKSALFEMRNMMDDMPGGYARLRVNPDGSLQPEYVNAGYCRIAGMSHDEVMRVFGNDSLAGVHPDDVPAAREAVAMMIKTRSPMNLRYRILRGDGEYIWMDIVCRITTDLQGNVCLNSYYTDASEQVQDEERQKALLDNLPGGAGIYELQNGELRLVYQNKSYWELAGLQEAAYPDPMPLSAVHPDDVPIIMQELSMAIQQGRDVSCDIQLKHLTAGYRPVHLAGRIVPCEEGRFLIFATFTPIAAEGQSYQQTLPLLLSAMMESTTDLAFAKDASFRYLSASRAFAKLVGYETEKSIIGKTDYELFDKALADKYRQDDLQLLADDVSIIDMVEQIPSADGIPHYSSTSKYILKDSLGKVVGIYGVGRDITLSIAQETQLSLVADTIPGGLASYTCTPGKFAAENVRLTYFNDGYAHLFGLTREELRAQTIVAPAFLAFDEDRHFISEKWRALMERNAPMDCLFRAHVKGAGTSGSASRRLLPTGMAARLSLTC